jgi:hypothetical protein
VRQLTRKLKQKTIEHQIIMKSSLKNPLHAKACSLVATSIALTTVAASNGVADHAMVFNQIVTGGSNSSRSASTNCPLYQGKRRTNRREFICLKKTAQSADSLGQGNSDKSGQAVLHQPGGKRSGAFFSVQRTGDPNRTETVRVE